MYILIGVISLIILLIIFKIEKNKFDNKNITELAKEIYYIFKPHFVQEMQDKFGLDVITSQKYFNFISDMNDIYEIIPNGYKCIEIIKETLESFGVDSNRNDLSEFESNFNFQYTEEEFQKKLYEIVDKYKNDIIC
jgi:hypothetical protein